MKCSTHHDPLLLDIQPCKSLHCTDMFWTPNLTQCEACDAGNSSKFVVVVLVLDLVQPYSLNGILSGRQRPCQMVTCQMCADIITIWTFLGCLPYHLNYLSSYLCNTEGSSPLDGPSTSSYKLPDKQKYDFDAGCALCKQILCHTSPMTILKGKPMWLC